MWATYTYWLNRRPIVTKSITSAVLAFTSDSVAQTIEYKSTVTQKDTSENPSSFRDHWDPHRSLRLAFYASAVTAPLAHGWYLTLDRLLGPALTTRVAVQKVIVDQCLVAAPFTCLFFSANTLLEGGTMDDVRRKLDTVFWPAMRANWMVWPAAMLINFRFVPLQRRVLFGNSVGFGWGIFMSLKQHCPVVKRITGDETLSASTNNDMPSSKVPRNFS